MRWGGGLAPAPLKACLLPSPCRWCHDAAAVMLEVATVAETPSAVMAHAQVVPQLMGHSGGDDQDTDGVVLWDRRLREGRWWEEGVGGTEVLTMLTPPERVGEHIEA